MLEQDLVIGKKYVPISKSIMGSLEDSTMWERALKSNQPFLYYKGKDDTYWIFVSNLEENGGDFFLPSDMIPYIITPEIY